MAERLLLRAALPSSIGQSMRRQGERYAGGSRGSLAAGRFRAQIGALTWRRAAQLLNEAYEVFAALQEALRSNGGDASGGAPAGGSLPLLLRSSRHYRALLVAHVQEQGEADGGEEAEEEAILYSIYSLVFLLFELNFLQRGGGGGGALVHWLKHAVGGVPAQLVEHIKAGEAAPEAHPLYWSTLRRLIVTGSGADAAAVLARHSQRLPAGMGGKLGVVHHIETLLQQQPVPTPGGGHGDEYLAQWRLWHEACLQARVNYRADLEADAELAQLVALLCGDCDALVAQASTWPELLVSEVLLSKPSVKAFDLRPRADDCIAQLGGGGSALSGGALTPIDELLLAVLDFDEVRAVRIGGGVLPKWMMAHLVDLLVHAGHLRDMQTIDNVSLREFFILQHAESLMGVEAGYQLAAKYFMECPTLGRGHLARLVLTTPLETERRVLKLMRICSDAGLDEEAREICTTWGMRLMRKGNVGAGCFWLLRAGATDRLAELSGDLLADYIASGSIRDLDAIAEVMGNDLDLSSGRLAIFGKFRDLSTQVETDPQAALASIVAMVASDLAAPKRHWFDLLFMAVPVLESPDVSVSVKDAYALLGALQTLTASPRKDAYLDRVSPARIEVVRLALARNLSAAVIHDAAAAVPAK